MEAESAVDVYIQACSIGLNRDNLESKKLIIFRKISRMNAGVNSAMNFA